MKQIRKKVFETNSSSCHSVTYVENSVKPISWEKIKKHIDEDGALICELGKFGWEIKSYDDPYDKINYLLTMIADNNDSYPYTLTYSKFYELKEVQDVFETIKNKLLGCDDKEVKELFSGWIILTPNKYDDNDDRLIGDEVDFYIDHQSMHDSIYDFLECNGTDLESFLFSTHYVLKTDNDNHY